MADTAALSNEHVGRVSSLASTQVWPSVSSVSKIPFVLESSVGAFSRCSRFAPETDGRAMSRGVCFMRMVKCRPYQRFSLCHTCWSVTWICELSSKRIDHYHQTFTHRHSTNSHFLFLQLSLNLSTSHFCLY